MTPEFSRPLPIERIRGALEQEVTATPAECQALARRLRIPAVHALSCTLRLRRAGDTVEVEGRLLAQVMQDCVVTLEPFERDVVDLFTVQFVPAGTEEDSPDPESVDQVGYAGHTIDLGEFAAEQLALALDPYPRSPEAEAAPAGDVAHL